MGLRASVTICTSYTPAGSGFYDASSEAVTMRVPSLS